MKTKPFDSHRKTSRIVDVDGGWKYEKVLYKAIRYTEDDDTKKEPVPYVFMSMAFFKISNPAMKNCSRNTRRPSRTP